jgi:hypothetical protein
MSEEEKPKPKSQLFELAVLYFKKEGYKVKQDEEARDGFSGVYRNFDLIVQKGRTEQGVWIKDWDRTIGVNVIIGLDSASADVGLTNPILIGDKFSDHARSYSNRKKITLLTKHKIATSLR